MALGTAIAIGSEVVGGVNRTLSNRDRLRELESRGVDVPFHQKFLPALFGMGIGGRFQEASLERKLARTGGPVGSKIPTRPVMGLGGDQALASTANVFRQQLSRMLGTEIAGINREFGGAGRFTSGQRLGAIQEAQAGTREEFGKFFASTALERYLQGERLSSAERIAQANIDAQKGTGRAQLLGAGIGSVANIFAQNPQGFVDFFRNLLTRGGGEAFSSNFYDQKVESLFS